MAGGLKAGFNPTFNVNPINTSPTDSIMSARHITTTSTVGQSCGSAFDDQAGIPDFSKTAITHIVVTYDHGSYIRSLTVHYNNKPGVMRGGTGSSSVDVILTPGEFITEVEGHAQSSDAMKKLAFRTSKGMYVCGSRLHPGRY